MPAFEGKIEGQDWTKILASPEYERKDFQTKFFEMTPNGDFEVTDEVKTYFDEHGFIAVRGLLDERETKNLKDVCEEDKRVTENTWGRKDAEGGTTKLQLWNNVDDGLPGMYVRSEKMVKTWEKLLGDEVYHYHTKLIMKEAKTGGAFHWHQDYGYWYHNGCVAPTMGTTWIAVDKANRTNGCLKIVPGSHKLGRQEHTSQADQVSVDEERMSFLLKRYGFIYAELQPGDALFFHANMLHRSEQNRSDNRRWAFLIAYNTKSNDPIYKHAHPNYKKIDILSNEKVRKAGKKFASSLELMDGLKDDRASNIVVNHMKST